MRRTRMKTRGREQEQEQEQEQEPFITSLPLPPLQTERQDSKTGESLLILTMGFPCLIIFTLSYLAVNISE